jgi:hypothetical protein
MTPDGPSCGSLKKITESEILDELYHHYIKSESKDIELI